MAEQSLSSKPEGYLNYRASPGSLISIRLQKLKKLYLWLALPAVITF